MAIISILQLWARSSAPMTRMRTFPLTACDLLFIPWCTRLTRRLITIPAWFWRTRSSLTLQSDLPLYNLTIFGFCHFSSELSTSPEARTWFHPYSVDTPSWASLWRRTWRCIGQIWERLCSVLRLRACCEATHVELGLRVWFFFVHSFRATYSWHVWFMEAIFCISF